ncbi:sialate O-acetylesterase [Alloscardovia omnicolens]|uniref:sialate O-acetylesterase n=1 Tax=Alloscardovia omnicolens TaxID=419015 RepID=UPI003A692911
MTGLPATGPAPGVDITQTTTEQLSSSIHSKPHGSEQLHPAAIFSHHMVLQRNQPIAIFGTGKPDLHVYVSLHKTQVPLNPDTNANTSCDDTAITTAECVISTAGQWTAILPALPAGGPYILSMRTNHMSLRYNDVMIGEVWLASGQSNMELPLREAEKGAEEIAHSAQSAIRFYNTPAYGEVNDNLLHEETHTTWQCCNPETSGNMSAVAYFFAQSIHKAMPDITIGIIDCYVGGTSISCWISENTLLQSDVGKEYLQRYEDAIRGKTLEQMHEETEQWQSLFDAWNHNIAQARAQEPDISWDTLHARYGECPWPPPMTNFSRFHPTGLREAMIGRIAPYSICGVLWYQGEEDTPYCHNYGTLLRALIHEWRQLWTLPSAQSCNLPFIIAQLPQYISKDNYIHHHDLLQWPHIRQKQWEVGRSEPYVYVTVLMDCGEFNNIHPTDKQTPGERMALVALSEVYDTEFAHLAHYPQLCENSAHTEGERVYIRIKNAQGLHFSTENPRIAVTNPESLAQLKAQECIHGFLDQTSCKTSQEETTDSLQDIRSGFEIAGADGIFHAADAQTIERTPDGEATLVIACTAVPHPQHIRYGWFSWGPAPLFNAAHLPAAPFSVPCSPSC